MGTFRVRKLSPVEIPFMPFFLVLPQDFLEHGERPPGHSHRRNGGTHRDGSGFQLTRHTRLGEDTALVMILAGFFGCASA